jgi:hypothetical protein
VLNRENKVQGLWSQCGIQTESRANRKQRRMDVVELQ